MVHDRRKASTGTGRNVLQHLQVTVRIAESGDRAPADELVNGERLDFLCGNALNHRLLMSNTVKASE